MSVDISVVIPTFRRPAPLGEALRSVLDQDGAAIEVLVLDDSPEGSARATVEALGDGRVSYRKRDVPSGGNPSLVRNEGWPHARGRFVHFLDDDDRVLPGAYRDVLSAFAANPGAGVVFGRIEPFGEDAAVLRHEREVFARAARRARLYAAVGSRMLFVANQLFGGSTLHVNSACMIRREHLAPLGGYDGDASPVEDLEFYIRAIRRFGCVFVERPVVGYRTGAGSIMTTAMRERGRVAAAYRIIYSKYRASHGAAELLALKVLGRTVLRWL